MLADGDACFVCLETRKGTLVDLYKEDVDRISFFDKIKFVVTSEIVSTRLNFVSCLFKLLLAERQSQHGNMQWLPYKIEDCFFI